MVIGLNIDELCHHPDVVVYAADRTFQYSIYINLFRNFDHSFVCSLVLKNGGACDDSQAVNLR